ncbi:NUDIX hydrolase [Candidatus Beckwithbacteria bacterium]|nr:NUDIX hydrolase [Candidatus Beckwithbacteria bacterium]
MSQTQQITACAFLYNSKGQVFTAKRAATKTFLPNHFELPGGHTEFGESLEESLIRELKEEFEIDVIVEEPFYTFTYLSEQNSIHTVEVVFFARLKNPEQKITLHPEDHSKYVWFGPNQIDHYFAKDDEEKKAGEQGFALLSQKAKAGLDYIGVSVGALIFNDKNQILLTKRSQQAKNERGCWEAPGGAVHFGETLEAAIRREMKEELGVEIEILKQHPAKDHLLPKEKQHWVPSVFEAKIKSGQTPRILEPDKCDDIAWFDLNKLPSPLSIITKMDLAYYLYRGKALVS